MATSGKRKASREKPAGRTRRTTSIATGQTITIKRTRPYTRSGTVTVRGQTWQERFLAAFREIGTISAAARAIGVDRRTVFTERQRNEEFALAFAEADEELTEGLEEEARYRALEGSDKLLEFLLKGRRPEKYSETHRLIHTGEGAGPVVLTEEEQARELEAFGMPAALAVAAGPDAVLPPEQA